MSQAAPANLRDGESVVDSQQYASHEYYLTDERLIEVETMEGGERTVPLAEIRSAEFGKDSEPQYLLAGLSIAALCITAVVLTGNLLFYGLALVGVVPLVQYFRSRRIVLRVQTADEQFVFSGFDDPSMKRFVDRLREQAHLGS